MSDMRILVLLLISLHLGACAHSRSSSGYARSSAKPKSVLTIDASRWRSPLRGSISSHYGPRRGPGLFRGSRYHHGVDIRAKAGTKIRAASSGRVIFAGWRRGFGRLVIVDHGHLHTYYAHCQSIHVQRGDWVDRGQWLARVGSSGRSTGPHLHFEIRAKASGRSFDPIAILKLEESSLSQR
jgi:murein DD-endopeptidase MepM/ murein hydrolase activator NlpD